MSYITQCFASRQVVGEGVPCRVVPLLQSRDFRPATCHPYGEGRPAQLVYAPDSAITGMWLAQEGFMEAIAGDRGEQTLKPTPHTLRVFSHLLYELARRGARVDLGENSSHEPAFDIRELLAKHAPEFAAKLPETRTTEALISPEEAAATWKALYMPIHRERVFMADHSGVFRPLGFGIILEDAYQWLLARGESTEEFGRNFERTTYLDKLIQEGREASEQHRPDSMQTGPQADLWTETMVQNTLRDGLKHISRDGLASIRNGWTLYQAVREVLEGKSQEDAVLTPLKGLFDDLYVVRGLDLCNVPFEPQRYAGDDYGNESGKLYAEFVTAMSAAVERDSRIRYSEDA